MYTKDSGEIIREMEEVNNFGKMAAFTKDTGKITSPMDLEDSFILMAMFMLDNGRMTKPMEKEPTFLNVGPSISVTGFKTNKMEEVNKPGLMKLSTLANIQMARNMEKENLCGLMTALTREIFSKITFMVLEDMSGKMEKSMKDNGKITKCKVKVPSLGLMAESMSGIMFKIENKGTEYSNLKTAGYTKASG